MLPPSYFNFFAQEQFHPSPRETRDTKNVTGPKDPYDYIRRTRLKADEWDTYWETNSESETTTSSKSRESSKPLIYRGENKTPVKNNRYSPEAHGVVSQFDPRNLNNHVSKSVDLNKNERMDNTDKRNKNDRRQSIDIRVTVCDLMEDEDSNQPESKPISNSEPSVKSLNSTLQGQSENNSANRESPQAAPNSNHSDPNGNKVITIKRTRTFKTFKKNYYVW